ncbi:MAG: hypothetical protein GY713_09300 [Actinomycetia bacterium]|nr:hypothetical protein [Actinomycetes bacterium]
MIRRAIDIQSTRAADDGGYILTMAGLILVPLVIVVGFAVDIGGWYLQAAQTQRAADAAALAGVVWMPDFSAAEAEARATARKNGFEHGVNSTVTVVEDTGERLRVEIAQGTDQYFTSFFLSPFDLERKATAEFIRPVPLGSPKNILGAGTNLAHSNPDRVWLANSGWCSSRENGDQLLAGFQATAFGSDHQCDTALVEPNQYGDSGGYWYSIYFAQDIAGPVHFQVYDARYRFSGSDKIDDRYRSGSDVITTHYEVRDKDDSIFDWTNNPILVDHRVVGNDSSWANWQTLETVHDPRAGETYYIHVWTEWGVLDAVGSNQYALRVKEGSTFTECSALVTASCPQLAAINRLPMKAAATSSSADFFLAEIEPAHAGKQLKIELFDIGEGASWIEILDPSGTPVAFHWSTECIPGFTPTGGCSGTTTRLDVSGCSGHNPPGPHRWGQCRYNDRLLELTYDIPSSYSPSGSAWWKIRYRTGGGNVTDRTTWGVEVIGDPVRLTG